MSREFIYLNHMVCHMFEFVAFNFDPGLKSKSNGLVLTRRMILADLGQGGASKMVTFQGWSSLKYSGSGSGSTSK